MVTEQGGFLGTPGDSGTREIQLFLLEVLFIEFLLEQAGILRCIGAGFHVCSGWRLEALRRDRYENYAC